MSPIIPENGTVLGSTSNLWFLVENCRPGDEARWRAYASIHAIINDAADGTLSPDIHITAVLAEGYEPECSSGFLLVESIYRLEGLVYLAQTVGHELLLDDGQTVQLIRPLGSG
jgi:hypothetical protein